MATTAPSNYPNAFLNGVTVREVPITISNPGKVFWLNNSSVLAPGGIGGSDSNPGTYTKPFSTLQGAINNSAVLASSGAIICVMPGHAESITSATALNLSKAGIAIVGLGYGTMRPTFTLTTANTSTITVSADNVSIQNCIFVANFLNIASMFTLTTAKGFSIDNCQIRDTSAILNALIIVSTSATSNANDDFNFTRNQVISLNASGVTSLISFLGTHTRVTVADNFYSAVTTDTGAVMPIAAGKVITQAQILRNTFSLVQAAGSTTGILITTNGSTNSGMIAYNLAQALDATTEILVTASSVFIFSQNYYSGAADKSGYLLPAADA